MRQGRWLLTFEGVPSAETGNVWGGFADKPHEARQSLSTQMQDFYQMPFEPFERYSPHGTPEQVAEFLGGLRDSGVGDRRLGPADLARRLRSARNICTARKWRDLLLV
jgi:hypothetical protein